MRYLLTGVAAVAAAVIAPAEAAAATAPPGYTIVGGPMLPRS